jgi:hypothetical protein
VLHRPVPRLLGVEVRVRVRRLELEPLLHAALAHLRWQQQMSEEKKSVANLRQGLARFGTERAFDQSTVTPVLGWCSE